MKKMKDLSGFVCVMVMLLAIIYVPLVFLSGCGTMSASTQATVFTGLGEGIGYALTIADATVLSSEAPAIEVALNVACASNQLTSPQAIEAQISSAVTTIIGLVKSVGLTNLANDINAKWTAVMASAEAGEATQALTDFQAFVTGLCMSFSTVDGVHVKCALVTPASSSSIDFISRLKWDSYAITVRSWIKK